MRIAPVIDIGAVIAVVVVVGIVIGDATDLVFSILIWLKGGSPPDGCGREASGRTVEILVVIRIGPNLGLTNRTTTQGPLT